MGIYSSKQKSTIQRINGWDRHTYKQCIGKTHPTKYNNLEDAKSECLNKNDCYGVYNVDCKDNNFFLCKESSWARSGRSCIYAKPPQIIPSSTTCERGHGPGWKFWYDSNNILKNMGNKTAAECKDLCNDYKECSSWKVCQPMNSTCKGCSLLRGETNEPRLTNNENYWAELKGKGPCGNRGERGEKGPRGLEGPVGLPGPDAKKSDTGWKGQQGIRGALGKTGPRGERGPRGRKGKTGVKGLKGNYAIDNVWEDPQSHAILQRLHNKIVRANNRLATQAPNPVNLNLIVPNNLAKNVSKIYEIKQNSRNLESFNSNNYN